MGQLPTQDTKEFRSALGMFATGVTIVTARAADGSPVGITANSFSSVSLNPPMVLWSLARNARSLPVFESATHWNVHILSAEQEHLSNRFARVGEDKFAGLELDASGNAAPLLPGCSARFQCRTAFCYEGGDHIIFVGEVLHYDRTSAPPLLYVTGAYALAAPKAAAVSTEQAESGAGSLYSEDLLGYLLGRAHYQFMATFRAALVANGLSDADFFIVSTLSASDRLSLDELATFTAITGTTPTHVSLRDLLDRRLLEFDAAQATYSLSDTGRDVILHVLAAAKAQEAALADTVGELPMASLRNLLKHVIAATDAGLPKLWRARND